MFFIIDIAGGSSSHSWYAMDCIPYRMSLSIDALVSYLPLPYASPDSTEINRESIENVLPSLLIVPTTMYFAPSILPSSTAHLVSTQPEYWNFCSLSKRFISERSKTWYSSRVIISDVSLWVNTLASLSEIPIPSKSMIAMYSLANRDVINNIGFSVAARYSDEYFYWSGVNYGGGTIDAQTTVDAQLTYMLQEYQTSIKLGINNLLGTSYTQAIGGPSIGQTMYLTFTFDNMFN